VLLAVDAVVAAVVDAVVDAVDVVVEVEARQRASWDTINPDPPSRGRPAPSPPARPTL